MNYLLLFIIGAFGIWLGYTMASRKRKEGERVLQGARKEVLGKAGQKKEKSKQKILKLFKKQERITNNDVEKLLDVSDATATNYLEELEQEDAIIQQGKTGRSVFYTLK